jgi:hypothetical protein
MAAPTKLQFEACSKTIIRRAKNALKKDTCADLNDHFPWREQQFHWKTSFLTKPLQTNEHVLEKVAVLAMALTLFYFCDPSKLPVPFWQKKLPFAEVNPLSPCRIQDFSPPSQKAAKVKSSFFHWFWTHSGPRLADWRHFGRRIVEPIEGHLLWLQCGHQKVKKRGGKWSLFRMPFTFLKSRPIDVGSWMSTFPGTEPN